MQSQITCPRCQNPFTADIHQIVDVGLSPEMKQFLLSGYLNAAQCPTCGAVTQVATPLLYHDPEHELFLVHVPLELSMQQAEREQLIGQLVRRAMDQLPSEQRRGYMFQPQTVISMQSLLEQVLETEGITREMIENQQKQSQLLQEMIQADSRAQLDLIKENAERVDGAFFALLHASLEASEEQGDNDRALKIINLQARLYKETVYGRKLEKQQQALHLFTREIKKAGQLTPTLLLKHVMANRNDDEVVEALVVAGQPAFNYEFFVQLSEKIEKRQKSGVGAEELISLRSKLLQIQEEMERQSKELLTSVQETIQTILESEDRRAAIRSKLAKVDSLFLNVLSSLRAQVERSGDIKTANELKEIQGIIIEEIENQAPPEIRLVNQLLRMENEEDRIKLLKDNKDLVSQDLLGLTESISKDAARSGEKDLADRAVKVEALVKAQLDA